MLLIIRLSLLKRLPAFTWSILTLVLFACPAQAQEGGGDEGEITINATPVAKDAIYNANSNINYKIDLKNTFNTRQIGTVGYRVLSLDEKEITQRNQPVTINRKGEKSLTLRIPGQGSGFYKVQFVVNFPEYDDTVRRTFGVDPTKIKSEHQAPADFDDFWNKTLAELEKVTPNFKVTEMPDSAKDNRRVFAIEMQSLGNITVRGWMTLPMTKNKRKRFPVLLGLPGYQVNLKPMFGSDEDLAIVVINVRGQGNSRDRIRTLRDDYIFTGLEDRNRYVMRGAIMDCVRMVDFIFSRDELDHDNIMVSGGSMGGFLSIATAGLDHRIKLCSAQNPILCDVKALPGKVVWPLRDFNRYVRANRGLTMDKLLDNLSYFDTKNFASRVKCPTLVGIGLLDHLAPPDNEYAAFNNLQVDKHMIVFKDLGHEVALFYKNYEGRWMRDTFALF
ncbi:acetylxylan esterase [Mucilaginibacter terrae]|uniref:Cephalosporin-C deacetylase n=1 Tax=Mucilaginibacter terrae TaxID=1955052 RepID=A0ABU3GUX3_9SPHI|nr:alpha/beta fold hydrolase [Mucilaginibacter terrae]MDT3402440.1 cephalosporin-C deacetylase [Mucilaginibacter terrae]